MAAQSVRIFLVDTNFQVMARRPGGTDPAAAVKAAERELNDLKLDFDDWLDQETKALSDIVAEAAADELDRAAWIDAANLHGRRLQDVASTLGFDAVASISRSLCDIFDVIAERNRFYLELVECHVRALELIHQDQYRDKSLSDLSELLHGLDQLVAAAKLLTRERPKVPGLDPPAPPDDVSPPAASTRQGDTRSHDLRAGADAAAG